MNERTEDETGVSNLLTTIAGKGRLIDSQLESALGPHGLSGPKLTVLHHLVIAGEPLPLGKLAERLACVRSNVTQLIDRLESEGLVRRTADSSDRRCLRAEITAEGLRRYEEGIKVRGRVEQDLVKTLSNLEREQLALLLSKFGPRHKF